MIKDEFGSMTMSFKDNLQIEELLRNVYGEENKYTRTEIHQKISEWIRSYEASENLDRFQDKLDDLMKLF